MSAARCKQILAVIKDVEFLIAGERAAFDVMPDGIQEAPAGLESARSLELLKEAAQSMRWAINE